MGTYLSLTPVDKLRQQMGVRFYSTWYYIRPEVVTLAKKSGLALNLHAFSGYQWYFLKCFLKQFLCLLDVKKPKKNFCPSTPEPHKGSAMDLLIAPPYPSYFLRYMRVSYSYNLVHLALPTSTFFSIFTPAHHFSRSYASSLLKPYCSRSLFTHSSHKFLGRPFFLFPVISSSITSCIWELMP